MKKVAFVVVLVVSMFTFGFDYPKRVATVADYIHLLEMPEHKQRALKELQSIYEQGDDAAMRVVSGSAEKGDLVTSVVENPNPRWKQKGFESRKAVYALIKKHQ